MLIGFLAGLGSLAAFDPPVIFLTWKDDPLRTMVVDWHTYGQSSTPVLQYRERGVGASWIIAPPETHRYPFENDFIHRVYLSGLKPNTAYEIRWSDKQQPYYFRTMPENLDRPLRIMVGGDVRHSKTWMDRMNRIAVAENPDFIVWGGDLAYADGLPENIHRWREFFDSIKTTLITSNRRIVPIVVGIGNHEVQKGYVYHHPEYRPTDEWRLRIAPYFYRFFAFPGQPGYGVLDFGDYLSIIILDTEHSNRVAGEQTEWLRRTLQERQRVRHVIPVQHVTAYPSHRGYEDWISGQIRQHWVPLYERYDIPLVFENHDHTYKRTFPILGGSIDLRGVVYVGDGAWGVGTRPADSPQNRWYLSNTADRRHLIRTIISEDTIALTVIDEDGVRIDRFEVPPAPGETERAIAQIFPRSRPVGNGYWQNDWLGQYDVSKFPWIYTDKHGWLFVNGRGHGGIWFYDRSPDLHWIWTNYQVYPYFFRRSDQSWIYFDEKNGSKGPNRVFYRLGDTFPELFFVPK